MKKLVIKQTVKGSPDGIKVIEYTEGGVYEMPEELAGVFIENDWAVPLPKMRTPEDLAPALKTPEDMAPVPEAPEDPKPPKTAKKRATKAKKKG